MTDLPIPKEISAFKETVLRLPDLPCETGIYFLYLDVELQYIGKTVTFPHRIMGHRPNKHFDAVYFLPLHDISDEDLDMVENMFIAYFRPPLNKRILSESPTWDNLVEKTKSFLKSKFKLMQSKGKIGTSVRDFIGVPRQTWKQQQDKIESEIYHELTNIFDVKNVLDLLRGKQLFVELNRKEWNDFTLQNNPTSTLNESGQVVRILPPRTGPDGFLINLKQALDTRWFHSKLNERLKKGKGKNG